MFFGTRASVHDEERRLVGLDRFSSCLELSFDLLLVLAEDLGLKLDGVGAVWSLVDSVEISECGRDGEVGRNGAEGLVDLPDLFRASEEILDGAFVLDSVFLASSLADFHFEKDVHLGHFLEVLPTGFDVFFVFFLGKIEHVAAEESHSILVKVLFVSLEHAIKPRQNLLRAMVRVHHDRNPVELGHRARVQRTSNGPEDGALAVVVSLVRNAFSCDEPGTTVGNLNDDGGVGVPSRLQDAVDGARAGTVERRNCVAVLRGMLEELAGLVSGENSRWKVEGFDLGVGHVLLF
mmetsp:Transcript_27143/g.47978  ORF Transcript_27143/g.47978 Transcript_27143/m.47978 type:complete len:292 (-) Transcript_27143:263-1138(-)